MVDGNWLSPPEPSYTRELREDDMTGGQILALFRVYWPLLNVD